MLILPREGGYVFRMYVELDKLSPNEKAARAQVHPGDDMIAAANRILRPYAIDVKEIVRWSIYDIGHSITDKFDDVPEGSDRNPRVFTAGDACHPAPPKAGRGHERVDADTFNLGWKLVHVLQGATPARCALKERLTEARRLVETDHEWARIMSAPPRRPSATAPKSRASSASSSRNLEFTGGGGRSSTTPRPRCSRPARPGAGQGEAGSAGAFIPAPVVRLADANRCSWATWPRPTRWRLYAFAGRATARTRRRSTASPTGWRPTEVPVVRAHRRGRDDDIDG